MVVDVDSALSESAALALGRHVCRERATDRSIWWALAPHTRQVQAVAMCVGARVGAEVGARVGALVGMKVGARVGAVVGGEVGDAEGGGGFVGMSQSEFS